MDDRLNIGVIGLGVMGQRMLARLHGHPRMRATQVWDADPAAVARTLAAWPGLVAAASAEALISAPGLASLYIATPPGPHMALANRGFDAGLAVLCEKPLTVDFDAARRTIARIGQQGQRGGVLGLLDAQEHVAQAERVQDAVAQAAVVHHILT